MQPKPISGFTLIELSIVLVIIGLIVGGILVGQDLIRAAYIRAQITQIEKFNTAKNTFYGKYQALPGDLNQSTAQSYGFAARGANPGQGDGNGIIEGFTGGGGCSWTISGGIWQSGGETVMFWEDLTYANGMNLGLIEGSFTTAQANCFNGAVLYYNQLLPYFPVAKIGSGNLIYAYSYNGQNYYGLSALTFMVTNPSSNTNIPVRTAYSIDKKIDDGYPISGNVTVEYINTNYTWSPPGTYNVVPDSGTAYPASATSCFDNGGNVGQALQYSTAYAGGNGGNCALSFKFQ